MDNVWGIYLTTHFLQTFIPKGCKGTVILVAYTKLHLVCSTWKTFFLSQVTKIFMDLTSMHKLDLPWALSHWQCDKSMQQEWYDPGCKKGYVTIIISIIHLKFCGTEQNVKIIL